MIHSLEKIPVTPASRPLGSTVGRLDFEAMGYVEEEYFFEGTANVYEEQGRRGKMRIGENIPYRNRLLIRRPADMTRFSGDVAVEILNATAGFDIDRMWVLMAKELMRTGAVYVGITSKPTMLQSLRLFDEGRYGSLHWSWDRKTEAADAADPMAPQDPTQETGMFWDMLSDLAAYLRLDREVIASPAPRFVYLLGWSQSANYMTTYVRRFYGELEEKQLFDGFLAAGNVHHFVTPLNRTGYGRPSDPLLTTVERMRWPFISVQTQSENIGFSGALCRQPDGDGENLKYRLYEIAGTTHDTRFSLLEYYEGDRRMEETGLMPRYVGLHPYPLDYPMEYGMYAVTRYLLRWVRQGIVPPASRLMEEDNGANRLDAHGNALGGLRGVLLEAPLATYHSASKCDQAKYGIGENPLFGYTEYFDREKLEALYGDPAGYAAKAKTAAEDLVARGDLLEEDREVCLGAAIRLAEKLFKGENPYESGI